MTSATFLGLFRVVYPFFVSAQSQSSQPFFFSSSLPTYPAALSPPRADFIFTSPPCLLLPSRSMPVWPMVAAPARTKRATAFGAWARKRLQQAAVGMRTVQRIPLPFLPSPFLGWPRARDDDRHILSYIARAAPHSARSHGLSSAAPDPNLGRNEVEGGRGREKENVCEEH